MKVPKSALLFKNSDEGAVEILAEGEEKNRFRLVGNSGKPFDSGYFGKMIIDLENLKLRKSPLPVLREHDTLLIAGNAKRVEAESGLVFEGEFSKTTATAKELKELFGESHKFESSIRIEPGAVDFIDKGEEAEINGQTVKGPMRILRDNMVSEVSFVLFGQDPNTSGKMIASENNEFIELTETNYRKDKIMAENNTPVITEQQLADAAMNERNRITAINAELPGEVLAEVRKQAIAGGKSVDEAKSMAFSVVQAASVVEVDRLKADNAAKDERLAAIVAGGGSNLLGQLDTEDEGNTGGAQGENLYLAEFNRLQNLGKTGAESVRLAAAKYPDAHTAWVKQQPLVP